MPQVPQPEELTDARTYAEDLLNNTDGNRLSKEVIKHVMKDMPPAFERIFDVSCIPRSTH